MDANIKLTERYKGVKLIFQIPVDREDPEEFMGLFNLKILKGKKDDNSYILGLQTSNPEFMPNYIVNIHTFFSRLTHQTEDNPIIGFYQLVPATNLKVGDFINLSFNDSYRFEEAPFQIIEKNDENVILKSLLDRTEYEEVTMSLEDFNNLQNSDDYFKYEKLEEDWFDNELEIWIDELKNKSN